MIDLSLNDCAAIATIAGTIGTSVVFIRKKLRRRSEADKSTSSGGLGGNAEVIGDGEARGGKGGCSGSFGPGGNGGDAKVIGKGKAIGGSGGNG
ncbi:hypothetical protein [Vibrio vulnificus]|uniref:hypothetical protein n=1 Tax=Vibrio vulnificus TaxID=672 RepID=UPI000CD0288A|nr:hypothetical protein [Vibrio vulnificus]EGQ8024557.1 hypothetical protein [Vibrio vulnificus]EGR0637640.1 hypothetical protein [Vibrio vulnificus]EJD0676946.1 hypothetical protein [Vibrio vulnificus]EJZ7973387.1 hypothetical protein [Vibrio vulnificus]POC11282.1 hypothetical protein CRN39_09015 [Vibrio vulnificus]